MNKQPTKRRRGISASKPLAWSALGLLGLAFCQTPAPAQTVVVPPPSTPSTPTAPAATAPTTRPAPEAMHLLVLLHDRDATLKDFTAQVRKVDVNVRLGGSGEIREGKAAYEKTKNVTKLGIHFDVLKGDGMANVKLDETLVFDGRYFIHKDPEAKMLTKRELVPEGQHFNPLKLGAGPMPLPIGQDPEEIIRDFVVTLEPVDVTKLPPGYTADDVKPGTASGGGVAMAGGKLQGLKLVPRVGGKFEFTSAELLVDTTLSLPVRILTVAPDTNTSSLTLTQVKINPGHSNILDVSEPLPNTGWQVEFEPYHKPTN